MFIAASASRLITQALSWRMKPSSGLGPDRIANHDVSGAGRKPEPVQCAREGLAELGEISSRDIPGQKDGVVLVCPDRLLATPFRSHQQEAAILAD